MTDDTDFSLDIRFEQRIMRMTWAALLYHKVETMPVDVIKICNNLGIILEPAFSIEQLEDGFTDPFPEHSKRGISYHKKGNIPAIRFAVNDSPGEQNFVLAHELGHHILGHVPQYGKTVSKSERQCKKQEAAAHSYAFNLIAPCTFLHTFRLDTIEEVASLFQVPVFVAYHSVLLFRKHYGLDNGALKCTGHSPMEILLTDRFTNGYPSYPAV